METRIAEFYAYMREREAIRLRRAAGHSWPWTEDPILQKYKFTNVSRAHDRTSRFLIDCFYSHRQDASWPTVLFNAAVFRYFGTLEFAHAVGWSNPTHAALERIESIAEQRMREGQRVFTGAYMVTNAGGTGPKHQVVCRQFLGDLLEKSATIVAAAQRRWHMEDAVAAFCEVRGFSTFMSKEVLLDTRYTRCWPADTPRDKDTWTGMGPGGRKGAAYIATGALCPLEETAALAVCREVFVARRDHWWDQLVELELADVQWNFCEMSKYMKVKLGLGRPRSLYRKPD